MKIVNFLFISLFLFSSMSQAISLEQIQGTIHNLYEQLDKLSKAGKEDSFEYREITRKIIELTRRYDKRD